MKSLQSLILEKITIKKEKQTSTEFTFDQIKMLFLYCVCFLKEEDLLNGEDFVQWGEMERYTEYKIDFYKDEDCKWISDYGCDLKDEDVLNHMDEIGDGFMSIMKSLMIHSKYMDYSVNTLKKIAFYILEYLDKYPNISKIDFSKIAKISTNVNGVDADYIYPKRFWDSIFDTVRNAESIINKIFTNAKALMNL